VKSRHSPETKAAAIAALLAGQSISSVAKEYKVPKGTVHGWRNQSRTISMSTEKKEEFGDLLEAALRSYIAATRSIAENVQDKNYIKSQPASELAVLFGVINDKAFRMIEAFGKHDD